MREHPAEQGSPEWLEARSTIVTASALHKILTPANLKYSESATARSYMYAIAGARLYGKCDNGPTTFAMQYGTDMEPEARMEYEDAFGLNVDRAGLLIDDDLQLGASPDGLIGEEGGLEIKCPQKPEIQIERLLNPVVPNDHRLQIQVGLLVTGYAWWDFFSYYPGMPNLRVRVLPDEVVHDAIRSALISFYSDLDKVIDKLPKMK